MKKEISEAEFCKLKQKIYWDVKLTPAQKDEAIRKLCEVYGK